MRFNTILGSAVLIMAVYAGPMEKRAEVKAGVSVSTNAIAAFTDSTNSILNQIQSNLQKLQALGNQTTSSASNQANNLQAQIASEFATIASQATNLQQTLARNLGSINASATTQNDVSVLAGAAANLGTVIARVSAAERLAVNNTISKSSTDVTAMVETFGNIAKALSGSTSAVQTFAGSLRSDGSNVQNQLRSNVSDLVNQTAQLVNGLSSSFGLGNLINATLFTGINQTFNASRLTNAINAASDAISAAIRQVTAGNSTSNNPIVLPGISIPLPNIVIPGFNFGRPRTTTTTTRATTTTTSRTTTRTTTTTTTRPLSTTTPRTTRPTTTTTTTTTRPSSTTTPRTTRPTTTTTTTTQSRTTRQTTAPPTTSPPTTTTPPPRATPKLITSGYETVTIRLPYFSLTLTLPKIGYAPTSMPSGSINTARPTAGAGLQASASASASAR